MRVNEPITFLCLFFAPIDFTRLSLLRHQWGLPRKSYSPTIGSSNNRLRTKGCNSLKCCMWWCTKQQNSDETVWCLWEIQLDRERLQHPKKNWSGYCRKQKRVKSKDEKNTPWTLPIKTCLNRSFKLIYAIQVPTRKMFPHSTTLRSKNNKFLFFRGRSTYH